MLSGCCRRARVIGRAASALSPRPSLGSSSTTARSSMAAAASAASGGGGARGAFILFEGLDRSGKSTQARKLVEALEQQGVAAELWNFPDRAHTVTGGAINAYLTGGKDLDDKAIHLLFSANRYEKRQALLAALQGGTTLVVDRYAFSGVAYSAAKGRPDMGVEWCKAPDAGLPAPDLIVFLQVSKEVAAQRAGFGQERYEKQEFQDKVRAAFEQLREPHWLVQDAAQPIEQIHQQVLAEALEVIKRCQEAEPLRQLWDNQPLVLQPPTTAAAAAGEGAKAAAPGAAASPAGARQQPLQERAQQ